MIGINIGICMLKTYRTYNPIVEFLKYKFNNKLLGGVTLLNECLNPWHVFMFEFSAFFFSFFPSAWTVTSYGFTMQETKCTVHALFTGPTMLFTHLKIILLQCFQFSVSAKISCIQTDLRVTINVTYTRCNII